MVIDRMLLSLASSNINDYLESTDIINYSDNEEIRKLADKLKDGSRYLGIPTGLCYQRLILDDESKPYLILHGLNAVYIKELERKLSRVDEFLAKIMDWGSKQRDIGFILLVGSHARGTARKDSDVDLVIITERPEHYLDNNDFIYLFGSVKNSGKEEYMLSVWTAFVHAGLSFFHPCTRYSLHRPAFP